MNEKKKRNKEGKTGRKEDGRMRMEEEEQGRDKEGKRKQSGGKKMDEE